MGRWDTLALFIGALAVVAIFAVVAGCSIKQSEQKKELCLQQPQLATCERPIGNL